MFQVDAQFRNNAKWQAAKNVYARLLVFYKKANIPAVDERPGCQRILDLMASNASLRNTPVARRSAPSTIAKLTAMDEKLRTTFRLWPANAEMTVKNAEDLAFLHSMKTDRAASFSGLDTQLAGVVRRREERLARQDSRRARLLEESAASTSAAAAASTSGAAFSSSDDESVTEPLTTPSSRSHHRQSRPGTSAHIPHDIHKRPRLVSVATRMRITPTQQAALTEAIIEESGGDTARISRSYATVDRSRRKVVGDVAHTILEGWSPPGLTTLHWDSKLMPSLTDNHRREERLTVVVGDNVDLKLLGTPSIQPGSNVSAGELIASHTMELLHEWHCADTIVSMCFDTTASNTGPVTAACVTIQLKLGRALLWSPCRHHIGELIVAHVFHDLKIEVSKSPGVSVFQRLRQNWGSLPQEGVPKEQLSRFDDSVYDDAAQTLLRELRITARETAQSSIDLRRDDYKEFAKLCDLYLSDDDANVNFMRPGAIHHARWMAKTIYAIKLVLLEQQITDLPRGTVTAAHQVSKLRDFVDFLTHVYCTWWLTSNSVTRAAWNDLALIKALHKYMCVNKPIAECSTCLSTASLVHHSRAGAPRAVRRRCRSRRRTPCAGPADAGRQARRAAHAAAPSLRHRLRQADVPGSQRLHSSGRPGQRRLLVHDGLSRYRRIFPGAARQ